MTLLGKVIEFECITFMLFRTVSAVLMIKEHRAVENLKTVHNI